MSSFHNYIVSVAKSLVFLLNWDPYLKLLCC